jgi:hypothetical protein
LKLRTAPFKGSSAAPLCLPTDGSADEQPRLHRYTVRLFL